MIRRFNYTGRRRLDAERAWILLQKDVRGGTYFEARLDFAGLGLPEDARVVVEAYHSSVYMRFAFGTVANPLHCENTLLTEFYEPASVQFRVKVIAQNSQQGVLLAEADGIRPVSPEDVNAGRRPLLPVRADDLGGEAWRLSAEGSPELRIDRRLGDPRAASREPSFVAYVYPNVLRSILTAALEQGADDDGAEDWTADWIRFSQSLPGVPAPPLSGSEDVRAEWVDRVVGSFCRQHGVLDRLLTNEEGD